MGIIRGPVELYPEKDVFTVKELEAYLAELRQSGYGDNAEVRVNATFAPLRINVPLKTEE